MNTSEIIYEGGSKNVVKETRRFGILYIILLCAMTIIIFRSAYLQIFLGDTFRTKAENNRVDTVTLPAPRGVIYDKNHIQLTENISSTDVVFNPRTLPSRENESYLLDRLAELLPDIPPIEVRAALDRARKTQQETLLAKAIDHETVLKIEQTASTIQGATLASSLVRKYPLREALAHVLGYTSSVTADELTQDPSLIAIDATGKQGIEKKYDAALRGQHGITYTEVTASGKQTTDLGEKPASPGQDITLTIDSTLQQFIYGLFSERTSKAKEQHKDPVQGSAIVLNPKTGAILALVSFPSFDPNTFSQPSLRGSAEQIFKDPLKPLFNRAIDGTYPSGSTIKPFLAAGALEEGIITESTTVRSTGAITVGPWRFADWKTGGHGITDVKKALAESVNTFFYMVAGGLDTQKGLGVDKATKYLREFGWDAKTGIDLPSESKGFLPSPQWKLQATGQPWYIGDTYHLGIGQGDALATPLQIAVGTSAIANGNAWFGPHLIAGSSKKHPLSVSAKNMRIVQEGMRQAVTEGSARSLNSLPIPIAGKTGTAQIGGSELTHAWFTSFGPYGNPDLVVTVLLERGGAGDVDAVPFAQEIWQWLSEHTVNMQ
ncbi:MAG TPA: penicillin-binding protein 2 [Candidatus Andersenbacteria bacterium]|nr:penicillin-binding protein 2 [Candidatus Andersenbacteria bacterium]